MSSNDYQERFVSLIREITTLQWVRESLSSHSKYYEGLKKKLEKQVHLKTLSEKELIAYRLKRDGSSSKRLFNNETSKEGKSYSNIIESVRFYDNAVTNIESQMEQASDMLQELNQEKAKLDGYCNDLHALYDEVIIDDPENASIVFEQHLRRDVIQLSQEIPKIEYNIKEYQKAQKKLYEARESIETAMKSLPGATKFLDRQGITSQHDYNKSPADSSFSVKASDALAQKAYTLVQEASELCADVPVIPISAIGKGESVILTLTNYRGYRLKIESILRRQLNPRLHQFENQLSVARYQYEQRLIEWIDHQIITLEMHLRVNGVLQDNLEREISMLRMGSRAAIVAVASEATGRITVDDALDITAENALPQYTNGSSSTTASSSSSSLSSQHQESSTLGVHIYNSQQTLPTYAIRQDHDQHPPAYSQE